MSISLYMDVHVQQAITQGLRERGIDVLTAQEDGARQFDDPELVDRATELGRVLFSRDRHMLMEGAARQRSSLPFSGIVYAHLLNVPIGQCIDDLGLLSLAGEPEDFANKVEYLPLRTPMP